jgi:hypothetical protein
MSTFGPKIRMLTLTDVANVLGIKTTLCFGATLDNFKVDLLNQYGISPDAFRHGSNEPLYRSDRIERLKSDLERLAIE